MEIKVKCSVCGGTGGGSGIPPGVGACDSCNGTGLVAVVWDISEFTDLQTDVTKILRRTRKILDHFEIPDT